ncbi:uncharacterized protein SCO4090 [Arthrobacter sp. Hiyo8]|nr:uncharacterized protein SCO4090 [Arthrobacter sp. Hiyo8]
MTEEAARDERKAIREPGRTALLFSVARLRTARSVPRRPAAAARGERYPQRLAGRRRKCRAARFPRTGHPQGGDPFPTGSTDLVRITRVPSGDRNDPDAGRLLYCPSQLVIRAGLAANALMEGIHGPLADLLIPVDQRDRHQARIDRINASHDAKRVHTRASTWGIPFSWFSLFQESDRKDVVESGGRILTVRVWASLTDALDRARFAVANLALAAPDLDMLDDLTQLTEWLELFHVQSMVELDYGAVADKVYPDESPMDVRLGIECLAEGT